MLRRVPIICLSALLIFVQSGCGPMHFTTRSDSPSLRVVESQSPGTVALVAPQFVPEVDVTFPEGTGVGTAMAAGTVAGSAVWLVAVFASLSACALAPPSCGVALAPFLAAGAGTGALVGAAEASKYPHAEVTAGKAQETANSALRRLDMQHAIQSHAAQYGRSMSLAFITSPHPGPSAPGDRASYAQLRNEGVDNVLEIAVLKAGMHPVGQTFSIFNMTIRARFVRVSDGVTTHEAMYRFVSQPLAVAQWAENNGERFRRVLGRAYQDLAEQAVDRLLLVFDPPAPRAWAGVMDECVRGPLLPRYPTGSDPICVPCFMFAGRGPGPIWDRDAPFPQVDSLQPVLQWDAFPAARELDADQNKELQEVRNVSYEIRLHEAAPVPSFGYTKWYPGDLVYTHRAATPAHKIENPLNACTRYFWTFRARFSAGGQPRTTEWAGAYNAGYTQCALPDTPASPRSYYAFRTPCASAK